MVPALLSEPTENVMVLAPVLLLAIVRELDSVTPPANATEAMLFAFPMLKVPVVVEASTIGFEYVRPVIPPSRVAALPPPLLSPRVTTFDGPPKALLAAAAPRTV